MPELEKEREGTRVIVTGCPQLTAEGQWLVRQKNLSSTGTAYLERDSAQSEAEQPRILRLRVAEEKPASKTIVLRWQEGQEPEGKTIVLNRREDKEPDEDKMLLAVRSKHRTRR